MMRSFRSKPVGWRNDSYRHYLAAKGISTRMMKHGGTPYKMLSRTNPHLQKSIDYHKSQGRVVVELQDPEDDAPRSEKIAVFKDQPAAEMWAMHHLGYNLKYFAGKEPIGVEAGKAVQEYDPVNKALNVFPNSEFVTMSLIEDDERKIGYLADETRPPIYGHSYFAYKVEKEESGKLGSVRGIPVTAEKVPVGSAYPISYDELKVRVNAIKKEDTRGITKISFVNPRTKEQEGAWAQMLRGKRKLLIFSQPVKGRRMDGVPIEKVREDIIEYVIPHEVGHHVALYGRRKTDKDLSMAEARADAYVVGLDVEDQDVRLLKR